MCETVIFGGTFNPLHLGHEQIIEAVCNISDVKRLLLVPTSQPVHKVGVELASSEDRLAMCRIAAHKFKKAEVWDTELTRREKSYTYYTLLQYQKLYSDKPGFLCGADMLVTIKTWFNYKELIKLCRIIAVFRIGENYEEFKKIISEIESDGAEVEEIAISVKEVSSTNVRKAIFLGESLKELVSPEIEKYILKQNLYRGNKDMTIEEYKNHIKSRLSEKRYFHSLCVAEEAVRLSDRYGADKEKAYIAGLLHDVLKDTKPEEQLKFAKQFGIILSNLELSAPKLYHSLIGSAYVENILGIKDSEIINAIRYHTTARANMTPLEKVIYLADYTSRDRDYDGVEKMREAVEISEDAAMRESLRFTAEDLTARGLPIHPNTIAACKQYGIEAK